ncbi:hypothetical protein OC861_001075 [Tilletia horrida]|nr:hypothetical protein OC861_001075 [Tilletia horrida]
MIRNIAHANGLRRLKARDRPALPNALVDGQKAWAKLNKTTDWSRVIFTDACSLDTSDLKRKPYVTRMLGKAGLPCFTSRGFRGARKTVMIWSAIAHGQKSKLVRISGTSQPKPLEEKPELYAIFTLH